MTARWWAAAALAAAACGGSDAAPLPDASIDGVIGPRMVSGLVAYEDRRQQTNGRLSTTIELRPARAVSISVIADADGAVLATGITGDDGRYQLEFTAASTDMVHLLVATVNMSADRPLTVVRVDRKVHGFGGPAFAADATTADLAITEQSGEAEAFNVFDQAVRSTDNLRDNLAVTPQPLTLIWQKGSTDGTYYSGDSTVHLLGAADDDDGYDDTVILHEIGHFIEDVVGRSDSPGGSHDGSPTDPNLAWSEGFSTYWNMAVTETPFYGDSNAGCGWGYNAEVSVTRAPQPAGSLAQDVGENMITEILWDLADGQGVSDDDPFAGTHRPVELVQPDYLHSQPLRAAGEPGVDLVDFLDGFLVADGLTRCADVRAIVNTTHGFPYDFGGPAGPCP